jgi:hypothetical protein
MSAVNKCGHRSNCLHWQAGEQSKIVTVLIALPVAGFRIAKARAASSSSEVATCVCVGYENFVNTGKDIVKEIPHRVKWYQCHQRVITRINGGKNGREEKRREEKRREAAPAKHSSERSSVHAAAGVRKFTTIGDLQIDSNGSQQN